jgi:glutaredoxin
MDHEYKVVVYGEDYCPYCTKVKQLFNGLEI